MADGPVANLPPGFDAYAGYIDNGGIGVTFPGVLAKYPKALHLSISIHANPADCADVESGAMSNWQGYNYGYCNASTAGTNIVQFGRPKRLWTAHYTNVPHICTSFRCWPASPVPWYADGTQWTDHGGVFDESLLNDNFFVLDPPPPPPSTLPPIGETMGAVFVPAAPTHPTDQLHNFEKDDTTGRVIHNWYDYKTEQWGAELLPAPAPG